MAEGQYQKAIDLLLQDIQHSDDDESNKIFKTMHLTNAYILSKNAKNAKKYIDQLEGLILKKEDKRMAIRMSEIKLNYFELIQKYDSALFYSKLYIEQKAIQTESIKNNQAILLLSNLEAEARKKNLLITREILEKERIEKKAQQQILLASFIIVLLTTISLIILYINNIQKSKSKQLIEKKNEENELLLKELHHRVKNNLQIIYSLINLQKRRLDTKELNHSLSMVQNRIKTMSLVHQNLHDNESFKEVNLNAYIKTITDYLKTLYHDEEKEINFRLNIFSTIELSMDRAITIGLLLNEIISNSLKYAFKGKKNGLIQVEVIPIHDGFQMKISDDGIGFSTEQPSSKSLGMYLIKNLVKQVQGKYELEHFNGTAYTIYFKA